MATVGGQALPALEVHCDGSIKRDGQKAKVGPPSPGGCAFVTRRMDRPNDPWIGRWYALGDQVDSQHVELLGIRLALEYLVEAARSHGQQQHREVWVYSDCGHAIEEIQEVRSKVDIGEHVNTSAILTRISDSVETLEGTFLTPVRFGTVPGHAGIPGNVEADQAAVKGAWLSRRGNSGVGFPEGGGAPTTAKPKILDLMKGPYFLVD